MNRLSKQHRLITAASAVAVCSAALAVMLIVVQKHHQGIRRRQCRSRKPAKYRRLALLRPVQTSLSIPWNQILSCGTDDDFLLSTNFTKDILLHRLLPIFEEKRQLYRFGSPFRRGPKKTGRNPLLKTVDLLGLSLWYIKTKQTVYSLCPLFGVVDSTIGIWLDYSLDVLCKAVQTDTNCEIRWPSVEEMKRSEQLLTKNRKYESLLKGVFGVTDGGRMPCAVFSDPNMQNAYFEGFTQSVEVTNLFVFNFFGEIIHAAVNYPGSWHDTKLATVSGLYYPKLSDDMTPPGMAILGDSAIVNNSRITNGKIIRGRKAGERWDIP